MIIPNHHVFTFVEQIGPFMCEQHECHKPAWSVVMTDAEYSSIPEGLGGEELAHYVIFHHLGKRTCKTCLKAMSAVN